MASNYRSISQTSRCCKTLEHIICKHILIYLENNKIVSPLQHAFCNGHTCESQLILTMHDIMQDFDSKQQTDLVISDFSKAFDTVPQKKLLFKLSKYGITGNINKWIQSFLVHRQQQVIVEGESSKPCSIDSGVPQGSVLDPLLFLCHIVPCALCLRELHQKLDCLQMIVYCTDQYIPHMINYYSNKTLQP